MSEVFHKDELNLDSWFEMSIERDRGLLKAARHASKCHDDLVEALDDARKALMYCQPFMQIIPGVQEPDCTTLFQAQIDINAALAKARGNL